MNHLRKLAKLCGLSTSYRDMNGAIVKAKRDTLRRLLEALLEHPLPGGASIAKALAQKESALQMQLAPLVIVAWEGLWNTLFVTQLKDDNARSIEVDVNGVTSAHKLSLIRKTKDGRQRLRAQPKRKLPFGYHKATLRLGTRQQSVTIISAPLRLPTRAQKALGLFTPVYALRSESNAGIGDIDDLKKLSDWFAKRGGDFIATLPLLACHYDGTHLDPSPYAALSRLFLNEIYLPTKKVTQTKSEMVDYGRVYKLKKQVLRAESEAFFTQKLPPAYTRFLQSCPEVAAYARFRSKTKRDQHFHLYCQFQMHEALSRIDRSRLMLDLPVGCAKDSFDAKHYPDAFLKGVNAGAPPDRAFRSGQDWGFYPLHPHKNRLHAHAYLRRSLERQLQYAQYLRLDHVAGLHRIFAIPEGRSSREGTYLRFHADELYAVLMLEAHRVGAVLIGEDLGVVPQSVRDKMARHGISGMWVCEFAMNETPQKALARIPANSMALLDTHDTLPLFGFAQSLDEKQLQKWSHFLLKRKEHPYVDNEFVAALLHQLMKSKCSVLQINLEDLWLEIDPQNVPGTGADHPNWRRKHRYTLEEIMQSGPIKSLLASLKGAKQ